MDEDIGKQDGEVKWLQGRSLEKPVEEEALMASSEVQRGEIEL